MIKSSSATRCVLISPEIQFALSWKKTKNLQILKPNMQFQQKKGLLVLDKYTISDLGKHWMRNFYFKKH